MVPLAMVVLEELPGRHLLRRVTEPTDAHGYPEVLVAADRRREMKYLSLGRRNTTAAVAVGVGHGDAQPLAPNDPEEGRARNRRIEAIEL